MNLVPASLLKDLPRRKLTVRDVEGMVRKGLIRESERFELLFGEMIEMSPKGNWHETLKADLIESLFAAKPTGTRLLVETTLQLSPDTFIEPDIIVFPATVPVPDLRGDNLLLAIEIADSSLAYDLNTKPAIYAAYGVLELWVIDARRRVTTVHRSPEAGRYTDVRKCAPGDTITPALLPALSIVMGNP